MISQKRHMVEETGADLKKKKKVRRQPNGILSFKFNEDLCKAENTKRRRKVITQSLECSNQDID